MKKVILFLVAIVFIACKGPQGPAGLDGYNGAPGTEGKPGKDGEGVKWSTMSFKIKKTDWELSGKPNELKSYYFADVKVDDLSEFVYNEGTVIGYIETAPGIKNGLPYVVHWGEEDENGKEFLWTQTYDFDFEPGFIRFYATFSDFMTMDTPEDTNFHIVLMW